MSDLSVRDARSQIAALRYEGVDSIRDAATLRERMAATVDLARRARFDAREHMWNAREAERALGRMILAAREAGDLAERGRRSNKNMETLHVFGIDPHLAALAVRLARVPEEMWQAWREIGIGNTRDVTRNGISVVVGPSRPDAEPTQRAIDNAAKEYERRVEAEAQRKREAEAAVAEAEAEIEQRTAELEHLAAQARTFTESVAAPPLLPEEVDTAAAAFVVPATAVEPMPERDKVADEWTAVCRRIAALRKELESGPPRLPADFQADITVLAARDVARSATAAIAEWIRRVNDLYTAMTQEGQR